MTVCDKHPLLKGNTGSMESIVFFLKLVLVLGPFYGVFCVQQMSGIILCNPPYFKVDEHSNRCGSNSYSCVDCGKDFSLSAARGHNTCITEEEKYQGKLYNADKAMSFGVE